MPDKQDTKAPESLDDIKTEVFNKVTGPRGAHAVLEAAKQKKKRLLDEKERLKQRGAFIEGQLASTDEIIATLELMIKECGLSNVVTFATGTVGEPIAKEETVVADEEMEKHRAAGRCLYVHFVQVKGGRKRKFCNRKGSKKYGGYCKMHWDRVNGGKEN